MHISLSANIVAAWSIIQSAILNNVTNFKQTVMAGPIKQI